MRMHFIIMTLCMLAVFPGAGIVIAQTADSTSHQTDPGITPLSVLGVITDLNIDDRRATVKTSAGNQVIVTFSDRTEFMRIPPGEKTKDKFIKITSADFSVGDSVFARGRMSEDRKNVPALEFYVMSKGDITKKRESEREDWRKRGIVGPITALNPETKEITLNSRTPEGPKAITIATKNDTKFRRYAPDSVRFSDAQSSSFAELKVGDQLRALGNKSSDGVRFVPEEIVSGSFQTVGGAITAISPETNEIKINDFQSNQPLTVVLRKDSTLRRLTPEVIAILAPPSASPPGATAASSAGPPSSAANPPRPKGAGDLQEMFEKLPSVTLQELKPGEVILVSSTKGSDPARVTAIALVSGVGPLLQTAQPGRPGGVALGTMNLGGIGGP